MPELPSAMLAASLLALPALHCASARSSGEPEAALDTVSGVDLTRYAGRWYEIARLPNRFQDDCARNVMADYSLRDDGRIDVVNRCTTAGGDKSAAGVARIVDAESRAKLKVRFAPAFLSFIPAVWGDYWIIDLADDYSHALIGEPKRRYLWVLSRTSTIDKDRLQRILERAAQQGFAIGDLVYTEQSP